MNQPTHADLDATFHRMIERLHDRLDVVCEGQASIKTTVEANGAQAKAGFEAVESRLKVIEAKVVAYDLLKARVAGMVAAGVVAFGVVSSAFWMAFGAKVEAFFGIGK